MNPVTIRLIAVLALLALEITLILLNIPRLSLVAGIIILLGALLFILVPGEGARGENRKKPDGNVMAVPSTTGRPGPVENRKRESSPFTKMAGRVRQVFSRSNTASVKKPLIHEGEPEPANTSAQASDGTSRSRFETFRALGQGLGLLFSSRRRSRGAGNGIAQVSAEKPGPNDRSEQVSLTSVEFAAVSPVLQKQEPSPFSPLTRDMVIDENLILSRIEPDDEPRAGILDSDLNLEVFADENEIAHMDISIDAESTITIDEDEEDEVAQILEAHQADLATPASGIGEFSIEKGLDELEGFDLDLDDVDLEGGPGTTAEPRGIPSSPGVTPHPDSPKRAETPAMEGPGRASLDESMLSFTSAPSGDDDLLSSIRSDMAGKKDRVDKSLVRDLKDVRVHIDEIEKDITDLLALYKKTG